MCWRTTDNAELVDSVKKPRLPYGRRESQLLAGHEHPMAAAQEPPLCEREEPRVFAWNLMRGAMHVGFTDIRCNTGMHLLTWRRCANALFSVSKNASDRFRTCFFRGSQGCKMLFFWYKLLGAQSDANPPHPSRADRPGEPNLCWYFFLYKSVLGPLKARFDQLDR